MARKHSRGSRRPGGSAGRGPRGPRSGGRGRGGSSANKGCVLILFAFAALPAFVAVVLR